MGDEASQNILIRVKPELLGEGRFDHDLDLGALVTKMSAKACLRVKRWAWAGAPPDRNEYSIAARKAHTEERLTNLYAARSERPAVRAATEPPPPEVYNCVAGGGHDHTWSHGPDNFLFVTDEMAGHSGEIQLLPPSPVLPYLPDVAHDENGNVAREIVHGRERHHAECPTPWASLRI